MKKRLFNLNRGKCMTLLCALAMGANAYAQGLTVKGHVVDENNEPIIGANILVKGTTNGTITDYDGNFTLEVSDKNAIIRIGYIGYKDYEVSASQQNLVIVLKENSEMLEDVVVIGYGTVKKSDATGSVTAIKPDDFNKVKKTYE